MKTKLSVAILFAMACLLSTGCVKGINTSTTDQGNAENAVIHNETGDIDTSDGKDIVVPSPEVVEAGEDGKIAESGDLPEVEPETSEVQSEMPEVQPEMPVVQPETPEPPADIQSNLTLKEYAPLTADKWDIKLPKVELKPGKPDDEHSPKVEQELAEALKRMDNNDLAFLRGKVVSREFTKMTGGAAGGGGVKMKAAPTVAATPNRMPAAKSAPKASVAFAAAPDMQFEAPPVQMNTAEFSQFDPNRFINAAANPLSTFGADVDTASYGVFRNEVLNGNVPKNKMLRVEEMINYFKYDYPNPRAGEPFSVTTEISPCPWNNETKLLLIGAKTRELTPEERPPSNIVFLLDISGSMYGAKRLDLIKASIVSMLPRLTANDRVSIVTYSGAERFIIDGVPGDHHKTIMKAMTLFEAGGVTNGEAGIKLAYAVEKKNYIKGGNNRIIMGTDGDLNVGISSTNELKALIEKKRESGIFLSVLGVGMSNYKDNRLEALADYGNGNYYYIDSLQEGRRVLVDEFASTVFVAAKDVKFQIDFNPGKIKGYRQIGYETRRLNAEDFADDTKDGGEVGSGHQVTILYEIVEQGSSVEVPEPSSRYQRVEAVQSNEYATVKLRYKKPDGDVSSELSWPVTSSSVRKTMSKNMNFASAVAATCMILNDSVFKGSATYDSVLEQLKGISSLDEDYYRAEFVTLVRRLKGL